MWWGSSMSSVVKVLQLPWEILCKQTFFRMTLCDLDLMTLKTLSVQLHVIGYFHVKFGEDPSTLLEFIVLTRFSKMTSCDLDLWPHNLNNLISSSTCHVELPRQVWWRSFNSLKKLEQKRSGGTLIARALWRLAAFLFFIQLTFFLFDKPAKIMT